MQSDLNRTGFKSSNIITLSQITSCNMYAALIRCVGGYRKSQALPQQYGDYSFRETGPMDLQEKGLPSDSNYDVQSRSGQATSKGNRITRCKFMLMPSPHMYMYLIAYCLQFPSFFIAFIVSFPKKQPDSRNHQKTNLNPKIPTPRYQTPNANK